MHVYIDTVNPVNRGTARLFLAQCRLIIVIAVCAFVPTVVISLLAWHFADILQAGIFRTNLDATEFAISSLTVASFKLNSWGPMLHALQVLGGEAKNSLYEVLFFQEGSRFQYPSTSLLLIQILGSLGLGSLRALNAVNALVFCLNAAANGVLAWRLFNDRVMKSASMPAGKVRPIGFAALAVVAGLLFYPIAWAIVLGQIQIWIDFLFTLAVIAWISNRPLLTGLLIGMACTIKPQFALLLPWGLLWREWRFCGGILAVLLLSGTASLLLYGVHNHIEYLQVLLFLSSHGESYFPNNSVNGILHGYLSPVDNMVWTVGTLTPYNPAVHLGTIAASVVALIVLLLPALFSRGARPGVHHFCAAAICTVVGSPVAWEHHYGILLPIFLIGLHAMFERPGKPAYWRSSVLTLSWALVANYIPFANLLSGTQFSFAQASLFFGALLLLGLTLTNAASSQRSAVLNEPIAA